MGVTVVKFDIKDLRKQAEKQIEEACISTLSKVCQECISIILNKHDWLNHTGCMESSVGGVVAKQGKIVATFGFKTVLNGAEGSEKGLQFATELAQADKHDFSCHVVVGVEYASYVESKGRDVISSSDLWARAQAENMAITIENKINNNVD